jgi:hypothetical protein
VKRSRLVTSYTSQFGFDKRGIVNAVIILALLVGVFQAKAVKLTCTNSCIRLLSKVYASDEQNLPIGLQAKKKPPAFCHLFNVLRMF